MVPAARWRTRGRTSPTPGAECSPTVAQRCASYIGSFRRPTRRIHRKPSMAHITACRPWLEAELAVVKPEVLVCLGATAAQALLGKAFKVSKQRGEFVASTLAPLVTATVHPSSILRAPDDESRRAEMRRFVADLKKVAAKL